MNVPLMAMHPHYGPVSVSVSLLPDEPDAQAGETIRHMRRHVRDAQADPRVRAWASRFAAGDDARSPQGARRIAGRIHAFVKRHGRFVHDERIARPLAGLVGDSPERPVVEVLIPPPDLLRFIEQGRAAGDCDDFSMLAAALAEACDIPASFITIAAASEDPSAYSHVYVVARLPGGEAVPLDASHGEVLGWEVPRPYRRAEWAVEGDWNWLALGALAGACWWLGRREARA